MNKMFDKEFCDKIEEIRVNAHKDYSFMLSLIRGDEDAIQEESRRKIEIANAIAKEKSKFHFDENSTFGQMLANSSSTSKMTEEELETVMEAIEKNFVDKQFRSKDVLPTLPQVDGEPFLNNRKLPSRLKKLAEFGKIEEIPNTKPKAYKLIK